MKCLSLFATLALLVSGALLLAACQPIQPAATTVPAASTPTWPVVEPVLETHDVLDIEENVPADARLGDADDPAIWVHPSDPALSLVIGAVKDGGLDVYDLDGQTLQAISPDGARFNNVDVLYGFPVNGATVDLAVTTDRYADQLVFFAIDPQTRQLTDVTDPANALVFTPAGQASDGETTAYGITLYHSAQSGKFYAFVTQRDANQIAQVELMDKGNGLIGFTPVRMITLPVPDGDREPQAEGMVADQELGVVYIAQEDVGIWKFGAEPDAAGEGTLIYPVAPDGETLVADAEGLTIYYAADGKGYLLASSQGDNRFSIYTRDGDNAYLGSFFIGDENAAIDGVQECDGAQVINIPLGARFPQGLLVVHDGLNSPEVLVEDDGEMENANTNFKFVPWDAVATAFATPLVIDTESYQPRHSDTAK